MDYLNKEHEERFYKLMGEDNTEVCDRERQSLLYILAGNRDLYQKKNGIYDVKNHSIIPCLTKGGLKIDLSGGAKALVKLGFNLYNGTNQKDADICDIFYNLDEDNRRLALNAIKIRFM